MDFNQYTQQLDTQSKSGKTEKDLARAAQSMESGAMDMRQTSHQQMLQMQMLTQSIQQQQQSINNLASSVNAMSSSQRMSTPSVPQKPITQSFGNQVASGIGPMMQAAGQNISNVSSMAANYAIARADEARQNASMMISNARNIYGTPGSHPGMLSVPQNGMLGMYNQTMGLSYNPAAAQNYTFGAYQRAAGSSLGRSAQNMMLGGYSLASNNMGFGAALGMVGGAVFGGPIGSIVGGMAGGAIGGMMDKGLNPFVIANEQMERSLAFGSAAANNSNMFLRGGGSGRTLGTMSTMQQNMLGSGISRDSMMDLTFSNSQITELQSQFAMTNQFTGVKDASQYRKRAKELMSSNKFIMQTLQATNDEAVELMDQMYNQMGARAGGGMGMMASRMYAASLTSGMSPMQVAEMMTSGARGANGMGLRADLGASNAASSIGLAGRAAGNINPSILATIGGERGLSDLLAQQNMRFMGGMGGTMMALGGGFGTNIHGGLSRAAGSISGSGDMISFLANRHNLVSNISPEQAQAQQFMMMSSMSDQLQGVGGSSKDRMMLLARAQGMSPAEAEAFVQAGMSMPDSLRTQMRASGQQRSDYESSELAEQYGFRGRIRRGYREFAFGNGVSVGGVRMGIGGVTNAVSDNVLYNSSNLSDAVEAQYQMTQDKFYGIEGRGYFGGAERIQGRLDSGKGLRSASGMSGDVSIGGGEIFSNISEYTSDPESAQKLQNEIRDAASSGDVRRLRQVAGMVKSGSTIGDFGIGFEQGVTNDDIQAMVRGAGIKDKGTLSAISSMAPSSMTGTPSNDYMSKDERYAEFKKIFGSGFSDQEAEEAMGSDSFASFINKMKRLIKMFKQGDQKQSKEFKVLEAQAIAEYEKLEGASKKLADKFINKYQVSISGNRITFRRGGYENMTVKEKMLSGLGFRVDEDNLDAFSTAFDTEELFGRASKSIDREQEIASIEDSLSGFGASIKLDKTSDLAGQMDLVAGAMSGVSDEQLLKVYNDKSATMGMRKAARIEYNRRGRGANSSLTESESMQMAESLVSAGLSGTEGAYIDGGDKLDNRSYGSQMSETAKVNRDTVRQLVELTKIIQSMKKD